MLKPTDGAALASPRKSAATRRALSRAIALQVSLNLKDRLKL